MYMKQIIKKFQNSMEAKRLKRFREETDLLISLLEKYSKLLDSQQSNFTVSKDQMWEQIKNEFNRQSHTYRTAKSLKDKYDNLKKKTKKTIVNQRKDVYLTGGGSNKMAGSGLYNNEDFDKGM